MVPLLNGIASTGASLLQANVAECEAVKGDVELMENLDSREEALAVLLDGVVLLCGDPWLLYASNERKRKTAHHILASSLGISVYCIHYKSYQNGEIRRTLSYCECC